MQADNKTTTGKSLATTTQINENHFSLEQVSPTDADYSKFTALRQPVRCLFLKRTLVLSYAALLFTVQLVLAHFQTVSCKFRNERLFIIGFSLITLLLLIEALLLRGRVHKTASQSTHPVLLMFGTALHHSENYFLMLFLFVSIKSKVLWF